MENFETKNLPWKYIGLTLGGLAAGAALGILFAPAKGEETRKKVGNWLKEKRDNSRELIAERKAQVAAALDAGKKAYRENAKKELVNA